MPLDASNHAAGSIQIQRLRPPPFVLELHMRASCPRLGGILGFRQYVPGPECRSSRRVLTVWVPNWWYRSGMHCAGGTQTNWTLLAETGVVLFLAALSQCSGCGAV